MRAIATGTKTMAVFSRNDTVEEEAPVSASISRAIVAKNAVPMAAPRPAVRQLR